MSETKSRQLGGTEYSWWRAVPGGTGITVLALLLSRPPDIPSLQNTLHNLQISHPILRSTLVFSSSPSFSVSPSPYVRLETFDSAATSDLLAPLSSPSPSLSPFHLLLQHQLNLNSWSSPSPSFDTLGVFFASLYALPDHRHVLTLRLHTAVCDRASAVAISKELIAFMRKREGVLESGGDPAIASAIEDLVPKGKGDKPFWSRGVDLVGYSLNSLRLSNLDFHDPCPSRSSEVVRLQMDRDETSRLLAGCRHRDIKLCGALAAAGLIAAISSKNLANAQSGNYTIVTLVDCRKILEPVVEDQHLGFYYSGILNTHPISVEEKLWDVAERCYVAFSNAKKSNKHFTDMGDLNFLMCKAIENPGLTPSSSQRTAFMSMFEETVVDDARDPLQEVGVEDYIGCSSVHGVGPSVAIFDTIRDGQLDCTCVYPSPLHSRKQMEELIDKMKKILVGG